MFTFLTKLNAREKNGGKFKIFRKFCLIKAFLINFCSLKIVKVTMIAHNQDPDAEMENVPKENVMIKKIVRNCIKPASMANARTSPV